MAPKLTGGSKQRFHRTRTPPGHGADGPVPEEAASSNAQPCGGKGGSRQRMRRAQQQPHVEDDELERGGIAFKNHIARLFVFSDI